MRRLIEAFYRYSFWQPRFVVFEKLSPTNNNLNVSVSIF